MCDCFPPILQALHISALTTQRCTTSRRILVQQIPKGSYGVSARNCSSFCARASSNAGAFNSDQFRLKDNFKNEDPSDVLDFNVSLGDTGTKVPEPSSTQSEGVAGKPTVLPKFPDTNRNSGGSDILCFQGAEKKISKMTSRKQTIKRSSMVAKQVIGIQSAFNLGFVSQLWVDTSSWVVLWIEVRPTLLSGESERFLLEDIRKVGDVVLVEDEDLIEDHSKIVGLDTLVGYRVVTSGHQNIGKVRGFTFNIDSGTLESLELDSFGISIIPSTLVSTYVLLVEDILEVVADTVVVHEAAVSRIQRITRGVWDARNRGIPEEELNEDVDLEELNRIDDRRHREKGFRRRKSYERRRKKNWGPPLDYL